MATSKQVEKELTGRHVLLILLAFFGVMLAVNAYFTVVAVSSFRGEDVKGSYRQGLEYNHTIAERTKQKALGWTARINTHETSTNKPQIIVMLKDDRQRALTELTITGVLRHKVDLERDRPLIFTDTGAGRFTADVSGISGQWQLRAIASKGEDTFKFEQDIWVK